MDLTNFFDGAGLPGAEVDVVREPAAMEESMAPLPLGLSREEEEEEEGEVLEKGMIEAGSLTGRVSPACATWISLMA